jgi:hypothetical protein
VIFKIDLESPHQAESDGIANDVKRCVSIFNLPLFGRGFQHWNFLSVISDANQFTKAKQILWRKKLQNLMLLRDQNKLKMRQIWEIDLL